ncbi:hypothetical protein BCV69DRAFT_22026 [Microstroma glucosiphilum]|uniref:Uncharacterized protein n=1 Tax=Pseudomicrostroma glucosiphilum TaxID=1684307 RepID=A0A316UJN5_9BASI|nr:hypothetical protein BCV69DRAFT_22026 [Pseudomicrostroma glucosiphilum]PWN24173.1 hypothetical protein BCV69DRAFT_22026 [Pseudomicrostroma glucosiphilum]
MPCYPASPPIPFAQPFSLYSTPPRSPLRCSRRFPPLPHPARVFLCRRCSWPLRQQRLQRQQHRCPPCSP